MVKNMVSQKVHNTLKMNILFYDFAHIKSKPIIFLQLLWMKEKTKSILKKHLLHVIEHIQKKI
jgi:hypothetical protein